MGCKAKVMVLALTMCLHGVNGYTYEDLANLMDDLFNSTRYNKDVRPIVNQSNAIQIYITHMLFYIEDVIHTSGDLLTRSVLISYWTDEKATWSPEKYGGISKISVPKGKIWTPDIVIVNGGLSSPSDDSYSFLYLTNTGIVLQATMGNFQTKCLIDSTYYPYDRHSCAFEYVCQHYDANEVVLTKGLNMFLHNFTNDNEWEVEYVTSESVFYEERKFGASVSILNLYFDISRRPAYATISTALPTFMVAIIFPFACLIPVNTGERLSFLTTLLMSVVFMYMTFVETMPRDSLHISYAAETFMTLLSLNTVNTIWNVFVVRVNTWSVELHPIPRCVASLVRYTSMKRSTEAIDSSDTSKNNIDDEENTDSSKSKQQLRDINWTNVAVFLDKTAFVVQCIITAGLSIRYFIIVASNG